MTLLIAAHGTAAAVGQETWQQLHRAVAERRPDVEVRLCFLDVLTPSLGDALDRLSGPVVVVPALLSTGFHVRTDIPAVVAGRADVRVGRHLGPARPLSLALADRLAEARDARTAGRAVILLGSGSSDPDARRELDQAAADLAELIGRPVLSATLADDLSGLLGPGTDVALYLLAEGFFADKARKLALDAGSSVVAAPIGTHHDVVELIWQRFDEVNA